MEFVLNPLVPFHNIPIVTAILVSFLVKLLYLNQYSYSNNIIVRVSSIGIGIGILTTLGISFEFFPTIWSSTFGPITQVGQVNGYCQNF